MKLGFHQLIMLSKALLRILFCAFEVQENVANATSSAIILFILDMFFKLNKQFECGIKNKKF
jgi:hypothetical protein